jgi:RNA 2',3'-cyclic 3'-phosphodiesterase
VRLFVAVALDPSLLAALSRLSATLRREVEQRAPQARLTWVAPERLHFTVRFIGEVDEERAAAIHAVLSQPLGTRSFELTIDSTGTFPARAAPRVLWAGVGAGGEAMAAVEREVTARLATCGIEPESRPYRAHLTLARVREPNGLQARDVLAAAPAGPHGTMVVRAITLFQSRLSPKGPTYVPLLTSPLA